MVVISKAVLRDFAALHPDANPALQDWYENTKAADWGALADIRRTFNSVDYVKNDRYVFNIKGNDYRLVALIFFNRRTVYIRLVGTHKQYDKVDVSTV